MDDAQKEQYARLEVEMTAALGRATDEEIDAVAGLLLKQALAVRTMKNQPPSERMALANHYTQLRQQSDTLWMTMLGMGIKVVTTPEGEARAVGYMVETGEPAFGTIEVHPLDGKKKQ